MKKTIAIIIIPILVLGLFYFSYNRIQRQVPDNNSDSSSFKMYKDLYEDIQKDLIVLKIAHNLPISHPQHMAINEKFIPIIERGSDFKIRVEVYPNSSLGNGEQVIQGVKNGTIEMCLEGEALSKSVPMYKQIETPYLFHNYEEVSKYLNGDFGSTVFEKLNSIGLKGIAWSLNGFRQVSIYEGANNGKEKPRLAANSSDMNKAALESMGYEVYQVDADQTNMVLNQQMVVGHDNPPVLSYYSGWYDNVKKIYITKHSISPTIYIVSNKFWAALPQKYKELIEKAAQESAQYEIQLLKSTETEIFSALEKRGVTIEYVK